MGTYYEVCESFCNAGTLDKCSQGTAKGSNKYRTCTVNNCFADPVIEEIFTFSPFFHLKEYCEEAADDQGRERCTDKVHNTCKYGAGKKNACNSLTYD